MPKTEESQVKIGLGTAKDSAYVKNLYRGYSTRAVGLEPSQDSMASVRIRENKIHGNSDGAQESVIGERKKKRVRRRAYIVSVAAIFLTLWGCATTSRLDDKFDTDPLSSPPSVSPLPTPPADSLSYTVSQQVNSTVVTDPSGGRWLRITPSTAFIASPDFRKRAVIITSDSFTTSPPVEIRGHLRLRVDGPGIVIVGFRPVQGAQTPDFISGIQVSSFALPEGLRGESYVLYAFPAARIDDPFQLPISGKMDDYQPGTPTDIFWSIDQASRTFAASASDGTSQTATFPAASAGVATTPIQKLSLWVWLQNPSADTAVFIDNLYAEEYR